MAYANSSPGPDKECYKDFVSEIFTYPTTYIVDSQGNIIGAPISGSVKGQMNTVEARLQIALDGNAPD